MIENFEKEKIVDQIVEKFYEKYPNLIEKFGENGKKRTREDNFYHFQYLETAYDLENQQVFIDYALWLNQVLTSRGVGTTLIIENFHWIIEVLEGTNQEAPLDLQVKNFYLEALKLAIDTLKER